jgi:LacI family transcriptional regulator
MNGSAPVGVVTRERVQRAIEALGYRPSARARDLSLGRNTSVAIVARSDQWRHVVPMTQHLSESGLDVAIAADIDTEALRSVIDRVGGVVAHRVGDDAFAVIRDSGVPAVATYPGDLTVSRVVVDHRVAIAAAARALRAAGHDRVVVFDDGLLSNSQIADLRLIFAKAGLSLKRPLRQLDNLAVVLGGRRAPQAVLAASPLLALNTYNQARALGYLIPHELSIVAMSSDAATAAMGLSAIEEPVLQAAQLAAELVEHLMTLQRPHDPGIEVRLGASYVGGVTTRRAA